MRRLTDTRSQRCLIPALLHQYLRHLRDIRAHGPGGKFRMKLHAPGALAKTECLVHFLTTACKQHGVLRQSQHGLTMHQLRRERLRRFAEQRISARRVGQCDVDGADLDAVRAVIHGTSEGVRQQLMAITDTEHGHAGNGHCAQPVGGLFAPGFTVADHAVRAGHHHARQGVGGGQYLCCADIQHGCWQAFAQALGNPVIEIALSGADLREGTASTGNQDRLGSHRDFSTPPAIAGIQDGADCTIWSGHARMAVGGIDRYDHRDAMITDQTMPPCPRLLLPLFCALLLGGCALPAVDQGVNAQRLPDTALHGTWLDSTTQPMTEAHPGLSGLIALPDAHQAFAARMMLAESAERTLDVQYYIWHQDVTGTLLLNALHDAADRGVRVRLLLDDNGVPGMDTLLAALDTHPNLDIRLFNPFALRRPKMLGFLAGFPRTNRRMHNKSFTVDQRVAVIGGRNIGDEYFGASTGVQFTDLDVLAIGPAAEQVAVDFDRYWASQSAYPVTQILPASKHDRVALLGTAMEDAMRDDDAIEYLSLLEATPFADRLNSGAIHFQWAPVRMISDDPAKGLGQAARTDLMISQLPPLFQAAEHSVDLISPYFVPTRPGVALLTSLSQRGVRVRILTNSLEATNVAAVHAGYARYRKDMLAAGIELFEMRKLSEDMERNESAGPFGSSGASLHAKTFAIDGRQAFIGSFNFDPRSAELNTELGFIIDSPVIARDISSVFDRQVPGEAYAVHLDDRGRLYWTEQHGAGTQRFEHDPKTGFFKRARVKVLSWLPIEWML